MSASNIVPTEVDWEEHKAAIHRLYLVEKQTLVDLQGYLGDFGIRATKSQLEAKLKAWKFRRNFSKREWQRIDEEIESRKRIGKDTEVRLSGVRIEASTVRRATLRNRPCSILQNSQLVSTRQRTPEDFTVSHHVFSPASLPMEYCWPKSLPWLQFEHRINTMHDAVFDPIFQLRNSSSAAVALERIVTTLQQLHIHKERPPDRSISRLAAKIGMTMPELYPGDNLNRAGVFLSGADFNAAREFIKSIIFRLSNRLRSSRGVWSDIVDLLDLNGVLKSPIPFRVDRVQDPTLSAFLESLFAKSVAAVIGMLKGNTTPDHKAWRMMKWLLDAGLDPNMSITVGYFGSKNRTPLQISCLINDEYLTRFLLSAGADPNRVTTQDSRSPLELATHLPIRAEDRVKILLVAGASPYTRALENPIPVLDLVLRQGRVNVAWAMVENGVDLRYRREVPPRTTTDPLDIIREITLISRLAGCTPDGCEEVEHYHLVLKMLDHSLNTLTTSFDGGPGFKLERSDLTAALVSAAKTGHLNAIQKLLEFGVDINSQSDIGMTPLHAAAYAGLPETCAYLVEHGASLIPVDSRYPTPLHLACYRGQTEVVRYLADRGAPVNELSEISDPGLRDVILPWYYHLDPDPLFGCTSILGAIVKPCSPLQIAGIGTGNYVDIATHLLSAGAVPRTGDVTAAVRSLNPVLVEKVLLAGGDPNEKLNGDISVLQFAIDRGMAYVASTLLRAGSKLHNEDQVQQFTVPSEGFTFRLPNQSAISAFRNTLAAGPDELQSQQGNQTPKRQPNRRSRKDGRGRTSRSFRTPQSSKRLASESTDSQRQLEVLEMVAGSRDPALIKCVLELCPDALDPKVLTAAMWAEVNAGDWDAARSLIIQGANLWEKAASGKTVLDNAVFSRKHEFIGWILDRQNTPCDLDILTAAMCHAAYNADWKTVKIFLTHGADPAKASTYGPCTLEFAFLYNDRQMAQWILDMEARAYHPGALCLAVLRAGHSADPALLRLLDHRPPSDKLSVLEATAVGIAAQQDSTALLDILLASLPVGNECVLPITMFGGQDKNLSVFSTVHPGTYIDSVVTKWEIPSINVLPFWHRYRSGTIHRGSPVLLALLNRSRHDTLHAATTMLMADYKPDHLCFLYAVESYNCDMLRLLLSVENCHYANFNPDFPTPLQRAVYINDPEIVQMLLHAGEDVNAPATYRGARTALQHAVENGDLEVINLLLTSGAEVNAPPARYYGATALQLAAIQGQLGVAKLLLEHGADVDAPGAPIGGRTALEGAAEHGRIDVMSFLLANSVKTDGPQYLSAIELATNGGHMTAVELLKAHQTRARNGIQRTVGGSPGPEGSRAAGKR